MALLIDALDREWVVTLAHVQLPTDWTTDTAFWGIDRLGAVLTLATAKRRPAEADRVLAALARRAPSDDLAARTLLQTLMPGLKSIVGAHSRRLGNEETASAVIAAAYARIRTYPIERRPERIAANIVRDTRQVVWRQLMKDLALGSALGPIGSLTTLESAPAATSEPAAGELVLNLIDEAVRAHRLSSDGARVIVLTRIADRSCQELADLEGLDISTVYQRRYRAEGRLARAARTSA